MKPSINSQNLLSLLLPMLLLSMVSGLMTGCATVTVGKRSTAEAINAQRVTVLTGSQLSEDTKTRLMQAGLDEQTCLSKMPACLVALQQSSFSPTDKGLYGAYSELFYASALAQKNSTACNPAQSPSTDFAKNLLNSPVSAPNITTEMPQGNKKITCLDIYQDNLLQASRFAYIYLMYDTLLKNNSQPTRADTNSLNNPSQQSHISASTNISVGPTKTVGHAFTTASPPLKLPTTMSELPKERDIQIQDLYYASTDDLSQLLYRHSLEPNYQINDNHIAVSYNGKPPSPELPVEHLVSAYQLNLSGLNSISRRDGLGMNYVAILNDRYTTSIRNQLLNRNSKALSVDERIHPLGHSPVTLFMMPVANNLDEAMRTNEFQVQIFDPYQTKTVNVLGNQYALSANFSAPYALWLKDNALQPVSLLNLLAKNPQQSQPHLFMLEEYDPNKRVIIMLHGLASSPETWIQLTNDVFNDPTLRDNYQVWQIFYPTNIPMLENRYQIQNLIQAAFDKTDPTHQDKASHHAVLIGHSMGGIIGRMMLSNDNLTPKVQDMLTHYGETINAPYRYRTLLKSLNQVELDHRFKLNALPQVDRAIFISTPFQGTKYADKWFTRAIRRIIKLPSGFVRTISQNLSSIINDGELSQNPLGGLFLENGASQLSNQSFFMQLTKDVTLAKGITAHTIIATKDKDIIDGLTEQAKQNLIFEPSDGSSSHNDSQVANDLTKNADNKNDIDRIPQSSKPLLTPSQNTKLISNTQTTIQSKIPLDDPAQMLYNTQNLDKALQDAMITNQIGQQVSTDFANKISDGIVPYHSAHLDNVASEKILLGNHSVQTSPQAVLELRRILHLQLQQFNHPNLDFKDNQP